MGCDIHIYIEYKTKNSSMWHCFGERLNPGRNYTMFGMLAGVREPELKLFDPKGLPQKLSYVTQSDVSLTISDNVDFSDCSQFCTSKKAEEYNESYIKYKNHYGLVGGYVDESKKSVYNPDWHSHSWLNLEEYNKCIEKWRKISTFKEIEYEIILDIMEGFEKRGCDCRLVFWFDN